MKIATYNLLKGGKGSSIGRSCLRSCRLTCCSSKRAIRRRTTCRRCSIREHPPRVVWMAVPGNEWGSAVYCTEGAATPVPIPGFDGWVAAAEISEAPWLFALASSP